MTAPSKNANPLLPLFGQYVWAVKRGVGTFLTMEFGVPHLTVREPITPKKAIAAPSRRALLRRRAFVVGDWHFWIQHANWQLQTAHGTLLSRADAGSKEDECLMDLDGQKLLSAEVAANNSWTLKFDLGATLAISSAHYKADELWSLHAWNGPVTVCGRDGSLSHHTVDRSA